MKHSKTLFLLLATALAAVALAACGGGDDDTTAAQGTDTTATAPAGGQTESADNGADETTESKPEASVPTIVVKNGEPVGGIQELEFDAGEQVRFKVSSDAAEEIHLHGYDIAKEVPAGGTVEFDFPAEIEGIFEAELEGLGVQIAELQVNP
ncbi:MAG TPA: hypothetical protein VFX45_03915 [Solirubrobacterales bacterium]|nr:hypothetical protein [Solirubrobacterales bacterium]